MKGKDRILNYFLYISLICIGLIIGIAVRHYYNIPLSESINIIDLAALITTVFLAVYIPEVLDRKLQIKRDKKQLIEGRIEELQALYRKINLIIQGDDTMTPKDFYIIKNTLDISLHKLEIVITLLNNSKLDASFDTETKRIRKLCDDHRSLLLSDQMENKEFAYEVDVKTKEELLYNKIDEATSLLIFKISDA